MNELWLRFADPIRQSYIITLSHSLDVIRSLLMSPWKRAESLEFMNGIGRRNAAHNLKHYFE